MTRWAGGLAKVREDPRVEGVGRLGAFVASLAILALVAFGLLTMATMLRWLPVTLGILALAIVPLLWSRYVKGPRWVRFLGVAPVAVVVPVMALLGANAVWASAGGVHPERPEPGLAVAAIILAGVIYAYLRWVGQPAPPHASWWAGYSGAAAFGLLWWASEQLPDLKRGLTALATALATWIYLRRREVPEVRRPGRWAVGLAFVVVVVAPLMAEAVQGEHWLLAAVMAVALGAGVAGLYELGAVRGSQERRRARRVRGAYMLAGAVSTLIVAGVILTASDATDSLGDKPLPRAGPPRALPAIAHEHRPILLFDSGEEFRTPLDVEAMLKSKHVQLCPQGRGLLADCREVNGVEDLRNEFGNLRLDIREIQGADPVLPTTIYAQVRRDMVHEGWTDIDYWWYLANNPAGTGQGAMCGAGFVIPEITCFDHQSDWEGVTVVVDENRKLQEVHFAGHKFNVRVPWPRLESAYKTPALSSHTRGRDVARRPLVFIARGTHAAYPVPCKLATCEGGSVFEDTRHDGKHEWPCEGDACVQPFPARPGGAAGLASWNAFDGRWGSAVCIAKVYCARTKGPESPGKQGRFKHPWCFNRSAHTGNLSRPVKATPAECRPPGSAGH